jgi:phosphatidylserine/phosphatidylglycerophosphate/cardiolipin synthase-like enzyme
MLEALKDRGFDMAGIKLQAACHTKGIVVDSEIVVVGSHNWSNEGALYNRDASLVVYDPEVAQYYETAFLYDWENLAQHRAGFELAMPTLVDPSESAPLNAAIFHGLQSWTTRVSAP